jgi:murein DD-endopeptidase MepM/ murein hydrolase activator NlpD
MRPVIVSLLGSSLFLTFIGCRREIVPKAYVPTNAHDAYRHGLEEAGLSRTALGRDFGAAAENALRSPIDVEAPFQEVMFVDPSEAFAVGYRLPVKRGQRTEIQLVVDPPSDWRLFLDLFRVPDDASQELTHVASGGEGDLRLAFEPRKDGAYLLRVQSELLRGGSVTLEIRNVASLEFPVSGRSTGDIGSSFGAEREGGRRSHHGVDIFAPRHTEVVATSRARVRRVDEWNLGGRVVWLEDPARDIRLYFAHLETQDVVEGAWVEPGDRIGTVGNSGNARTTPPHLHFGVYARGEGPIDPHPFLHQPRREPPYLRVQRERIGSWGRTGGKTTSLFPRPHQQGVPPLVELPPRTPLRLRGGAGSSYRVELPNGVIGYVSAASVEAVDSAIESVSIATITPVRARPAADSAIVRRLDAGEKVDVLARFAGFALVESGSRRSEWVQTPAP